MKVLVTGAAGMLGRDVMLAAGNAGHDVVGFGRAELDVTDAAAAATGRGASVVYVSSDYVFDGAKGEPYVETDQPAPLSAYGRTKLAGEDATTAANKRHFVVRSSWLFGGGGGNFV